jgi:WD40 repeat protein
VYKLIFDSDGDLWTASADKTAKHLVREDGWKADTTLEHPDFVRDIVVHERGGWVVTACRDEEVRVWNRSTGDLYHTFSGHFEEVTGLCLIGDLVVSVSIDATVRQWSLKPADLVIAREEAIKPEATQEAEMVKANPEAALTEDEERELKELMENEERELQELMAEDLQ